MQKNLPDLEVLSILLSLPKPLGMLEKDEVTLLTGRYGPFVKIGKTLCTVPMQKLTKLSMADIPDLLKETLAKKKKKADNSA